MHYGHKLCMNYGCDFTVIAGVFPSWSKFNVTACGTSRSDYYKQPGTELGWFKLQCIWIWHSCCSHSSSSQHCPSQQPRPSLHQASANIFSECIAKVEIQYWQATSAMQTVMRNENMQYSSENRELLVCHTSPHQACQRQTSS